MAAEENTTSVVTEEDDTSEDNVPAKSPSVPAFLSKVWMLVDDKNTDEYIRWSTEGDCFIISDQVMFAKSVLPHFFKHNNMASFVRQLNQYGFRKKFDLDDDDLNNEQYDCAFEHSHFRRGELSQLQLIKRKLRPGETKDETQLRSVEGVRIMLSDIQEMKEKQGSITSRFKAMKRPSDVVNTVMEYDNILEDDGSEYQELMVSSANAASVVGRPTPLLSAQSNGEPLGDRGLPFTVPQAVTSTGEKRRCVSRRHSRSSPRKFLSYETRMLELEEEQHRITLQHMQLEHEMRMEILAIQKLTEQKNLEAYLASLSKT